jgi:hypothetical protein
VRLNLLPPPSLDEEEKLDSDETEALMTATDRDNDKDNMVGNNGIKITAMLRNARDRSETGALTKAKRTTEAMMMKKHDKRLSTSWTLWVRGSNDGDGRR